MSIKSKVMNSLSGLGVPVSYAFYSGEADTYITFVDYLEVPKDYSDDESHSNGHSIQVDIWSNGDYTNLEHKVKEKMKVAGFIKTDARGLYDPKSGFYHKAIRYYYEEECKC
jgi:hypothetical protein